MINPNPVVYDVELEENPRATDTTDEDTVDPFDSWEIYSITF